MVSVRLWSIFAPIPWKEFSDVYFCTPGGVLSKIDCKIKIVHDGEVNKARICPHNQFIIASKVFQSCCTFHQFIFSRFNTFEILLVLFCMSFTFSRHQPRCSFLTTRSTLRCHRTAPLDPILRLKVMKRKDMDYLGTPMINMLDTFYLVQMIILFVSGIRNH